MSRGGCLRPNRAAQAADPASHTLRSRFGREHPPRDMSSSGTGHCYGEIDDCRPSGKRILLEQTPQPPPPPPPPFLD
eukprot:gene7028-biopygen2492